MAIYMFSPFSIYFADEAQDNEVENEGDDASSKNQYLSQSKYGTQRGSGPRFVYQPNIDNRKRLRLVRNVLKKRQQRRRQRSSRSYRAPPPPSYPPPQPSFIPMPSYAPPQPFRPPLPLF